MTARSRLSRRRLLAGAALLALVGSVVLVATDPFTTATGSASPGADNGTATARATVARRSLSSQTQVSATLGYADASQVVMPAGTASAAMIQAQQSAASAAVALQGARAVLAADTRTLAAAHARLHADKAKQAADCRGDSAADTADTTGTSACATDDQTVATDEQALASAQAKVDADDGSVATAAAAVAGPETSLASARSSGTLYDTTSTYTMLPAVGDIIHRGQALYAVDDKPGLLLYGQATAWRAFTAGMSPGPDVAELNANLQSLGYGSGLSGDAFTGATQAAIVSLQRAHGLPETGSLLLGSVVFKPGAVRVTSVTPTLGATVQAGPVLGVSSIARVVTIELDAAQQAAVKVGDAAAITMPDTTTTPGRVSSVGSVATTPSNDNGQSGTPTVEVLVTPIHPAATGRLDQAPVQVSITTASVEDALVVPVDALLALAGGGYAVETVDRAGARRLVGVELGLFDDAEGLVQVTGTTLKAGQKIVVPAG